MKKAIQLLDLIKFLTELHPITKDQLVKIVYLLQEVYGIQIGYDIKVTAIGMTSLKLVSDIQSLASKGIINIAYSNEITCNDDNDLKLSREISKDIVQLVRNFQILDFHISSLEMLCLAVYYKKKNPSVEASKVIEKVKKIMPLIAEYATPEIEAIFLRLIEINKQKNEINEL